jgi:hypothetical protein
MVLVPFLMGISLSTPDWVECKAIFVDEYMDLSIDIEQDQRQSLFQDIHHVIGADGVGANAALSLWGPMSRPAPSRQHQPGHWTPLSIACTCLPDRKLLATDQRCMSGFLFASLPECSSNTAFPPYFAKVSLYSEQPLKVILRI